MKMKKIALSITLASVSLMALPTEGQLIMPPKDKMQTSNNNLKSSNNSDDILQLLDDVNKKRMEFQKMQDAEKEREKRKDKDYVLEQLKKDNDIAEEKLRGTGVIEREYQKSLDIEKIKINEIEEYRESAKSKIGSLEIALKNIITNYRVDGTFTISQFGDKKTIKLNAKALGVSLEKIMVSVKDSEKIKQQISYYDFLSRTENLNFAKNNLKYEDLYNKIDYISNKSEYTDVETVELNEGDFVYENIKITDISNTSYTLRYIEQ